MKKYAKIINEETKQCEVGVGTNVDFYKSIGMAEMDIELSWNGNWYVKGYAPSKPVEIKQNEVRAVRNSYLEKYVDPYQLVIRWKTLSEEDQDFVKDYRQYLLDYTDKENWWEENPMTFEEWKEYSPSYDEDSNLQ